MILLLSSKLQCFSQSQKKLPVATDTTLPSSPSTDLSVWPNIKSFANSDTWIRKHHREIRLLRPNVLVLNFVNPSDSGKVASLVAEIMRELAEGSRAYGYKNPDSAAELEYHLARGIIDMRDGAGGRPAAPTGFPYQNSTLWPRRSPRAPDNVINYAAFFSSEFARYYGYPNPKKPGEFLDLCHLLDSGYVHEVWFVASADVPDQGAREVLEEMPVYDAHGDRAPNQIERCAGNGCFESNVPFCGRSVRIGFINYTRGAGCYVHSASHGMEGIGSNTNVLPAMKEWFVPFAAFDLKTKYGLPFSNVYALNCKKPPCMFYNDDFSAKFFFGNNNSEYNVPGFDPVCGNAHFAVNGTTHYDYENSRKVHSSCEDFGRHSGTGGSDKLTEVLATRWSGYRTAFPGSSDCGGDFLLYWRQNMPGHNSDKTFADGRQLPSAWPFLFY